MARKKTNVSIDEPVDIDIAPGKIRRFPQGWSGSVTQDIADAIAAKAAPVEVTAPTEVEKTEAPAVDQAEA
ncbi:hypothetical protein [Salipiger thiooxidans]|jgi:hypothetical protein|uniref:hypothetical protein n=1 Tax=Salipiger thiooxidans TaxID=282683 RepID=UPI001CD38E74|nr:hypothetical protein [Salipiger thiooxidans]MCA0851294.1 hypothetical protein [Salipiger thiooxidans]